jgi:hypothetical protein
VVIQSNSLGRSLSLQRTRSEARVSAFSDVTVPLQCPGSSKRNFSQLDLEQLRGAKDDAVTGEAVKRRFTLALAHALFKFSHKDIGFRTCWLAVDFKFSLKGQVLRPSPFLNHSLDFCFYFLIKTSVMSVQVWTEEWIMLSHSAGRFELCLVSDISCPEISYDKSSQGSPAESRAVGIDVLLKLCNLEMLLFDLPPVLFL